MKTSNLEFIKNILIFICFLPLFLYDTPTYKINHIDMNRVYIDYPLGAQISTGGAQVSDNQTKQAVNRVLNQSFGNDGILESYIQTALPDSFLFELNLKPMKTIQDVHHLMAGITEDFPQIIITPKSHE